MARILRCIRLSPLKFFHPFRTPALKAITKLSGIVKYQKESNPIAEVFLREDGQFDQRGLPRWSSFKQYETTGCHIEAVINQRVPSLLTGICRVSFTPISEQKFFIDLHQFCLGYYYL